MIVALEDGGNQGKAIRLIDRFSLKDVPVSPFERGNSKPRDAFELGIGVDNGLRIPKLGNSNRDWHIVEKRLEPFAFQSRSETGAFDQALDFFGFGGRWASQALSPSEAGRSRDAIQPPLHRVGPLRMVMRKVAARPQRGVDHEGCSRPAHGGTKGGHACSRFAFS